MAEGSRFAKSLRNPFQWIAVGLILLVLGAIAIGQIDDRPRSHRADPILAEPNVISLCMLAYAMDHDGKYPVGKSSTEAFQKLLDVGYLSEPSIFYCEMPGKTKPISNKLKPGNVCWDITIPVNDHDSDFLPVVFLTGYKIQYMPGGSAVPLNASFLNKYQAIGVAYKNRSIAVLNNDGLSDGIVKHFISPNFDPAGKKYQQLTPDGPLPP